MAFSYRKLLPENESSICGEQLCAPSEGTEYCPTICVSRCPSICKPYPPLFSSPPTDTNQNKSISPLVIIIVAILGGTFLLVSYYAIIVKYCSSWTISRRPPPPQSDDTHEDFIDEDHGPVIDHPIWYIATVGLQQSIINSITVFKYKKEEGLVDGTQCSVCLNEFQEDESLRLLPKCSHAFHLPCIDTWLRSHTNCPLCRARIVYNPPTESPLIGTEPNSNNLGSGGETQVENPESDGGSGIDRVGGDGVSDIRVGTEDVGELRIDNGRNGIEITKECVPSDHAISEFRVLSSWADNRVMVEDDIQPLRRSVSMDSSSASMIFLSLANFLQEESEGSSGNQLVEVKKPNSEIVSRQGIGNSTIAKLIGSSSMKRSLQKGPISMKRSLSCGGKFLFRNSRSRNSILPL